MVGVHFHNVKVHLVQDDKVSLGILHLDTGPNTRGGHSYMQGTL